MRCPEALSYLSVIMKGSLLHSVLSKAIYKFKSLLFCKIVLINSKVRFNISEIEMHSTITGMHF